MIYCGKSHKNLKGVLTISKNNKGKILSQVQKITPKYHQSVVDLQRDYIDAWKTVINTAISLEKEYASQAGFLPNVSESTLQTIRDMTEISVQAYIQQNKFTLGTIEMTKQSFITFNETTKSFASLNEEIMTYLMFVFEQKLKT